MTEFEKLKLDYEMLKTNYDKLLNHWMHIVNLYNEKNHRYRIGLEDWVENDFDWGQTRLYIDDNLIFEHFDMHVDDLIKLLAILDIRFDIVIYEEEQI